MPKVMPKVGQLSWYGVSNTAKIRTLPFTHANRHSLATFKYSNMQQHSSHVRRLKCTHNIQTYTPNIQFDSINQVKHSKQACKIYLQHLDMHFLNKRLFNPTFISDIRLSIRHFIPTFAYSIRTFNTNIQSKHLIGTFDSKIQHSIRDSIRTFISNIQYQYSIRTRSIQTFTL